MPNVTAKIQKGVIKKLLFYGNFNENLKVFVMTMGGQNKGYVSFPPDYILLSKILQQFPNTELEPNVESWHQQCIDNEVEVLRILNDNHELIVHYGLYDYQHKGVDFLIRAKRAILADDRGLGKTIQSIIASISGKCNLVICPSYLSGQWSNEICKWTNKRNVIVKGTPDEKEKILQDYGEDLYLICSYRTVSIPRYARLLPEIIDYLIVDESHRISNRKTEQSKAIMYLSQRAKNVYFLTGSDFHRKSPETIFPMLNCIDPDRFSSYWNFFNRYVEAYQRPGGQGYQVIGSKNTEELAEVLTPMRLRRTKDEVAPELPEKIYNEIWVELTNNHKRLYDETEKTKLAGELCLTSGVSLFSYLMRLTNDSSEFFKEDYEPKFSTIKETIEDIISEGQKVLIFGYHKKYLRKLQHAFAELSINGKKHIALYIDGDVNMKRRDDFLRLFKETDNHNMLFATYGTIGEGTNLQECSNVICYEIPWNPEVLNQAIDRCHRITSRSPVNVYFILAKNTVDQHVYEVVRGKEECITEQNRVMKIIQKMKGAK